MIEWMCNSVTKMFLMYPNVVFGIGLQVYERASGVSQANTTSMVRKGGTGKASREEDEDDEGGSQCQQQVQPGLIRSNCRASLELMK